MNIEHRTLNTACHALLFTLLTLLLLAPRVQADPPVMSGLTVWLDATDLNGDGNLANNPAAGTLVSQWNNKAGSFHATQGNASYQPKMFRDATTGKDVVRFQRPAANTARYLLFNNSAIATLMGTTNTIFAVARGNMGSGDSGNNWCATVLGRKGWNYPLIFFSGYPFANGVGSFWRGSNDGSPGNGRDTSTGLGQNHDTLVVISATVWGNASPSSLKTILQVWSRDWTGASASAPVTNATYGLWSGAGSGGDANMLFIGSGDASSGNYTQGLEGDIGEILIYNRALSEVERAQVENYLAGRWITDYSTLLPVTLNAGTGRVRDVQVDSSATNYTHVFMPTGQCSFVVNKRIDVEYLMVAGGGGGGSARFSGSGGGGGGGALTNGSGNKLTLLKGTYTITVGAGGGGGTNSGGNGMNGFNGGDSSLTNTGGSVSVIAKGGGGGGGDFNNPGSNGGSGGGGARGGSPGTCNAPGQGKDGGAGNAVASPDDNAFAGGGGGGYSGVGQPATTSPAKGGDGGVGLTNSVTGYALSFAGGGGGARRAGGTGYGKDGGGNGVKDAPTAGAVNSGGGGGGNGDAGGSVANGAAGGSGIVIIKYALPGAPKGMVIYFR